MESDNPQGPGNKVMFLQVADLMESGNLGDKDCKGFNIYSALGREVTDDTLIQGKKKQNPMPCDGCKPQLLDMYVGLQGPLFLFTNPPSVPFHLRRAPIPCIDQASFDEGSVRWMEALQ